VSFLGQIEGPRGFAPGTFSNSDPSFLIFYFGLAIGIGGTGSALMSNFEWPKKLGLVLLSWVGAVAFVALLYWMSHNAILITVAIFVGLAIIGGVSDQNASSVAFRSVVIVILLALLVGVVCLLWSPTP
jgi:hypothetical protein